MAKHRRKRVTQAYHRCSDGVYRSHYDIGYRNFEARAGLGANYRLSAAAHRHEAQGYVAAARRKSKLRLLGRVELAIAELAAKANRAYHDGAAYCSPEEMVIVRRKQQLVLDLATHRNMAIRAQFYRLRKAKRDGMIVFDEVLA